MAGLSLEQKQKMHSPQPGEVWWVADSKILMDRDPNTIPISKKRPVLVISTKELITNPNFPFYNVAPLTTEGEEDAVCFKIHPKNYTYTNSGIFTPQESIVLLPYYCAIVKSFIDRCGVLDMDTYQYIVTALCTQVVGYNAYDLEP
jgi:hypothetical protein